MESDRYGAPVRVLHVLGGLNYGGAETMVMNLYRNVDRSRVQFDFAIHTADKCDYEDEVAALGGRIYRFPRFRGYNAIQYAIKWKRFFQRHEEYQIIHGHMRSTASIYLSIAKKLGRYTIAHSHSITNGTGIPAVVKNIMQLPLRHIADAFFACSRVAGQWLFGAQVCGDGNFYVMPNAIDLAEYQYDEAVRLETRARMQIGNRWVIGNIARFHEEKNHPFMLELVDKLRKVDDTVLLVLIGEGTVKEKMQELAQSMNLEPNILFLPATQEIAPFMQAFDAFILPSKHEGLGMVAIEAQMAQLPVFCSTGVPKEADLTGTIQFIDTRDIQRWMKVLLESRGQKRKPVDAGHFAAYDIHTTAKWIQHFYEEAADR